MHESATDQLISTQTQPDDDSTRFYLERLLFSDVSPTAFYAEAADEVLANNITDGCSAEPFLYCLDDPTVRGQMAVFIVRALLGTDDFTFPTTPYFTDVPTTHPFFKWIQKLRELEITAGCDANLYCSDDSITRAQMAVFLIRALLATD